MEYYVWKDLVIKKVQKEKNGAITVHEVTSIEQSALTPRCSSCPVDIR